MAIPESNDMVDAMEVKDVLKKHPREILNDKKVIAELQKRTENKIAVYSLFRGNKLCYVGTTNALVQRLNYHEHKTKGWDSFSVVLFPRTRTKLDVLLSDLTLAMMHPHTIAEALGEGYEVADIKEALSGEKEDDDTLKRIYELVYELEEKMGMTIPVEDLLQLAEKKGIKRYVAKAMIEELKSFGQIFEPIAGFVSRV